METEPLSAYHNCTNESRPEYEKKKKRKMSVISDLSYSPEELKKKKKILKVLGCNENGPHHSLKFLEYKMKKNYVKAVANPETLPPAPKVFHTNRLVINACDNSNTFLSSILPVKCFNTEFSERYKQLNINNFNSSKKFEKKKERIVEEINYNNNKGKESVYKESVKADRKQVNEKNEKIEKNVENMENVKKRNLVNVYKVTGERSLIFHMSHPSAFSFHGEIKATVIMGEIEILGCTLGHSLCRNSAEVYSPKVCTPLTVETKSNMKHSQPLKDLPSALVNLLTEEDYRSLLSSSKADDCILLVEQISSSLGKVLNKYFERAFFPKDLEDVSSLTETMERLQSIFTFNLSKEGNHLRKNPQWEKIPLGQCTVLCGGKGVGKSVLLRYYVNKLLGVGEKVVVLDFDPGQPEFTFPGCISAVVVKEPVIGPNFTHILDPIVMMYFGDVDVSKDPTKYIECVNYMVEFCKKNEELLKMKWLVNTMGFSKGLGVDLMITILKLLRPNTVIQIKASDPKNNYPFYLTSVAVKGKSGFIPMEPKDVDLSYELRVVESSAEREKKQVQGALKRKQLRDVMSMSYFSKMALPPFHNLNAVQPYVISFSKLYLAVDFPILPKDVIKAFNANIVSLSHFEPDGEEIFSAPDYFQIVLKPRVHPSLGIGFVRGIDCKERKIYVVTHLTKEALAEVNCLSLGRVGPPHCLFLRQEGVEGAAAYTTSCAVSTVRSVRRMFRVPGTPLG